MAARLPHPHEPPHTPRNPTQQHPQHPATALRQQTAPHCPPLRQPLVQTGRPSPLGRRTTSHHTLAQAHDLTWVERHYGYATARAYAGHTTHRPGTTATYVKADIHEIATALATLTQEPHPLALSDHHG